MCRYNREIYGKLNHYPIIKYYVNVSKIIDFILFVWYNTNVFYKKRGETYK